MGTLSFGSNTHIFLSQFCFYTEIYITWSTFTLNLMLWIQGRVTLRKKNVLKINQLRTVYGSSVHYCPGVLICYRVMFPCQLTGKCFKNTYCWIAVSLSAIDGGVIFTGIAAKQKQTNKKPGCKFWCKRLPLWWHVFLVNAEWIPT